MKEVDSSSSVVYGTFFESHDAQRVDPRNFLSRQDIERTMIKLSWLTSMAGSVTQSIRNVRLPKSDHSMALTISTERKMVSAMLVADSSLCKS